MTEAGPNQNETEILHQSKHAPDNMGFASSWHHRFLARMGSDIIFYICRCANFILVKSYMYYLLLRCDVKVESLELAVKFFV